MIYFLGDTHGKFTHIFSSLKTIAKPGDAAIFLGDVGTELSFNKLVAPLFNLGIKAYFIAGNHDTDKESYWQALADSEHSLHGKVLEINGYRVAGLSGVFRGEVWNPKDAQATPNYNSFNELERKCWASSSRQNLDHLSKRLLKHKSSIFPDDYYSLSGKRVDILVTHEAPSAHPYGFKAIDELALSLGVKKAFHGHHHDRLDYASIGKDFGFTPYGVGLRGISDIDGNCIVAGELDFKRKDRLKTHF